MVTQSKGTIYLSGQRGVIENQKEKLFCTFNFGHYQHQFKMPFGGLCLLNDETLAPETKVEQPQMESSYRIVLPIRGEVNIKASQSEFLADVEDVFIAAIPKENALSFENTYPAEWINYLHLKITSDTIAGLRVERPSFRFSAENKGLIRVLPESDVYPFSLSIGIFEGRQEELYTLCAQLNKVFCYVIKGAFEVEGRLLHQGDGLGLWDLTTVDIEALSNGAVLLMVELEP